jgi:hypothetical protein
MTGTPFDGLGKSIVKGIGHAIRKAVLGVVRCDTCGTLKPKAEVKRDFLARQECADCERAREMWTATSKKDQP